MMRPEQPVQSPRDEVHKSHAQCAPNVAAAQAQVATRNQRAPKQGKHEYGDYGTNENAFGGALRKLVLSRRRIPRIGRFEIDGLAVEGRSLDMHFLIGMQRISAIPGAAFVIRM